MRFRIYDVLPENNIEVDDVEMRFKAVNNSNDPDINTIYIGDEFFMYIKYKGCKCQTKSFQSHLVTRFHLDIMVHVYKYFFIIHVLVLLVCQTAIGNSVSVAFLLFTTELRKQHDNHPHQMFILDKEHEVLIMF